MGLLTKEVEIRLEAQNIKYYENLGYEIPRYYNEISRKYKVKQGTTLMVKIQDLPLNSNVKVEVECDYCHKRYMVRYCDYNKCNHDGKTYCTYCSSKVLISGKNHYYYNPNKTDEERIIGRNYSEYNSFVKRILARDNYTCQCCESIISSNLEVHHLDGYNWCKEKRTDDTNGITLCKSCHSNFHSNYGVGYNTKQQFEEWLGKSIELLHYNGEIITTRKIYCVDNDTVYKSAEDVCKNLGIYSKTQVYNVCNQKRQYVAEGYHFLWYDVYTKMSKNEIKDYVFKCDNPINYRKVICIETKEIFNKVSEACLKYGKIENVPLVIRACKEFRPALNSFGTKLHWMYYDEYLEKLHNNEEIQFHKNKNIKTVICVTTGKVFNQINEAGVYYNIAPTSISSCCKKKRKSAGKLSDGTCLIWMYYEEFLQLTEIEQSKILSENNNY